MASLGRQLANHINSKRHRQQRGEGLQLFQVLACLSQPLRHHSAFFYRFSSVESVSQVWPLVLEAFSAVHVASSAAPHGKPFAGMTDPRFRSAFRYQLMG